MPRGYRDYFIALGIAGLLALASAGFIYNGASTSEALYNRQAEQAAQAYRDTASIHAQRACIGLSGSKLAECVHDQRHAARERERGEYDLQAQLVTSAWTKAMGYAALMGMVVGILGVGLVYVTFRETRRSATAAEKAVIETRTIGQAQTRCYLSVTAARMKMAPSRAPRVIVVVKNSGNSPAERLKVEAQIRMVILGGGTVQVEEPSALTQLDDRFEISAGEERTLPPLPVGDNCERWDQAIATDELALAIKVRVRLSWRDVFGIKGEQESHWSAFPACFGKGGTVAVLERHEENVSQWQVELMALKTASARKPSTI